MAAESGSAGQAGLTDITEEMAEAGAELVAAWDSGAWDGYSVRELAIAIFRAMESKRPLVRGDIGGPKSDAGGVAGSAKLGGTGRQA